MWWVRLVQLARASSLFENHSLLANTPSLRAVIDVTLLTDIMIFHSTYLSVWILYLGEIFHHLVLLFILICTINNYIAIIILKLTLCIIQSCIISMLYLAFKQKLICIVNLTARAACGRPMSALSTWSIFLFAAHRRIEWQHGEWGLMLYLVASTDSINIRSNRAKRGEWKGCFWAIV